MIPQAQIPQYNAQANQMMGQVAQGIGQLGQAYQDRGFRQDMGGVQSSKDLMELYTMHPDKYDPVRVKQMQQQEEEAMNSSFFEQLEGAQNQSEALNVIKSDPSRYSKKVGEFMQSLPSPKKDALRKDFLEEGAYVNTGKMDQLPALFEKREALVNASDLPPEEKQERLDEITEDREALEAGEDIFAERHRLSEEGVLGAENYEKITKARGNVGDASRAAGSYETDLDIKKQELAKAVETVKQMTDSTGKVPKDKQFAATEVMAKRWQQEGGDFIKIDRQYQDLKAADLTGVGGLNMILSFMKMKDPTSVVSGQEVITAKDAPGWGDTIINIWNKAVSKGEVSAETAAQFLKEAGTIHKNAKSQADRSKNRIGATMKKFGLDPDDVFNRERSADVTAPPGSTGNAAYFQQKYSTTP